MLRSRLSAIIWIIGLITVGLQALALSSRYFQPWLNADYLYPQLFAEDVLAGYYPLAGWTLSSAPYFFPDMAVAFGLRVLGGSGTVLPAYVVFFYLTLAVLSGWSLQRATRTGWTAWLGGVALVNVLLLWQNVGDHVSYLWLLGTVGFHGGVVLLGLANFTLWVGAETDNLSRTQRGVAFLLFFLGAISDSLLLTQAVIPLGVGLGAQAGWDWRRPLVRSYFTTLLAALGLVLLVRVVLFFGGYFRFSKVVRYAPTPSAIIQTTLNFVRDLRETLVPQGWGLLFMALVALSIVAFCWVRERLQGRPLAAAVKPALGLALVGLLVTTGLPLVSVYWRDATHARYILPWIVWPGWLALAWHLPKISRWCADWRGLAALGLLWVSIGVMTWPQIQISKLRWPYTEQQAQLDEFLIRHDLRYGLSDYWHAHTLNTLSHAPVRLFGLRAEARASFWNNNAFWFFAREPEGPRLVVPKYTFIIIDGLDETAVRRRFGEPAVQDRVGGLTLWLYSPADSERLTQQMQLEVRTFLHGRPGEELIIDGL